MNNQQNKQDAHKLLQQRNLGETATKSKAELSHDFIILKVYVLFV